MLNELLERKITEAAEWFCDNPNCGDIEDALRELVAEAMPNLEPVIAWLENGCDPKDAAKELRIYQERMRSNAS